MIVGSQSSHGYALDKELLTILGCTSIACIAMCCFYEKTHLFCLGTLKNDCFLATGCWQMLLKFLKSGKFHLFSLVNIPKVAQSCVGELVSCAKDMFENPSQSGFVQGFESMYPSPVPFPSPSGGHGIGVPGRDHDLVGGLEPFFCFLIYWEYSSQLNIFQMG